MTAPPGDAPERFGARDALVLAGLLGIALGTRAAGIPIPGPLLAYVEQVP
ncbi:MAG: hypothetical protein GXY15_12275 [Candidatus Hydrogenedentes bacterium]|nr:hypothetical protein [Candidatus Hydrogenedentota bacterium]